MKEIDRRKFMGSCISGYGLAGFNDILPYFHTSKMSQQLQPLK